jgi:hypothetical protein
MRRAMRSAAAVPPAMRSANNNAMRRRVMKQKAIRPTRRNVFQGKVQPRRRCLTKEQMKKNKRGQIVSRKHSDAAK